MFDNLREQADSTPFDSTPFYEDEEQFRQAEGLAPAARARKSGGAAGRFLGMTPQQRFILDLMLFIAACALGSMFLLIAGKISLLPL